MKKLIAFFAVIIIIAASSAVFAEVLLTDNFNITGGTTTDLMTDLAIRQSGSLATKPVAVNYAYGGSVVSILSTGVLDLNGGGASLAYINNNFFSLLTLGKTLHYSVEMNSIEGWSYITISNTGLAFGYGVSAAIEVAGAHAYLHSQTTSGVWKTEYLALPAAGWHKWDIYVTQTTASIKHVEMYLDGGAAPVYTNDCDSANWPGGSINLQASVDAQFDNVSVELTPDPPPVTTEVLLTDNFNITGGDTTDLLTDLALRQSGSLATKDVVEGYAYSGAVTSILSTGVLDLNGGGASLVYINNNFFSSLTPGGTLHYSVEMNSIIGWSYITISNTGWAFGYDVSAAIEVAGAHAYLHSQDSAGVWDTRYLALPAAGWHKWDIYVTQTSAAIKHIEMYLDGDRAPVYINDCDSANWAGGSVNLQASIDAQFDNVSVKLLEPIKPTTTMNYSDDITVDGDLSDWADAEFVPMDKAYYPDPSVNLDMSNAAFAHKWGDGGRKVYIALKVQDSEPVWSNWYTYWNANDHIEAQLWASGVNGTIDQNICDIAQQYEFGLQEDGIGNWSYMCGAGEVPAFANLNYAITQGIDGWVFYEAAMTPFTAFNRLDEGEVIPRVLEVDDVIGADAVIASKNIFLDFNMLAADQEVGKSQYTRYIKKRQLVREGVMGTVELQDFGGTILGIAGTATITDGTNTETHNIVLDAAGQYSFTTALRGECTVIVKCSHWLGKSAVVTVAVSGNGVVDLLSVINGDVVDNNEVDFSDINATRAAYGSFPGDDTWNDRADVDGSGEVDFTDINIVRSKYGEIGE